MGEKFELIAKTFQGLEVVLAKELVKLGAEDIVVLRRGVSFKGDLAMMYKANLCLRTALRIIKPIFKFSAVDPDEVYEKVKAFDWNLYMDEHKTFSIDAVVFSDAFRHSKYLSYRVKDAIVDRFREQTGQRPSVRLNNPDVKINVHVSNTDVTVSLDSSGEPLFKRGYRTEQTEAPINEVLAAGLLLLAGWDGSQDLIDPMCGSGTFLVEAALIAANIAPGIYRKSFAFEKWNDFDQDLFQSIYDDDSQEREFQHVIYGSDILKNAISIATDNVKSAGVSNYVKLKVCPIEELPVPSKDALVIFNPPYGERLKPEKLSELYDHIGRKLKNEFTDMNVWIVSEPNEAAQKIGLAPSVRIPIDNGGIACDFRKYEIFAGRRDDYIREKAMNEAEAQKEEENPGYTFYQYSYDEPGTADKDATAVTDGKRSLGHRTEDGSRSARSRSAFFHTDRAKENNTEVEDLVFDTPEEREAYYESRQRHDRFVAKQKREQQLKAEAENRQRPARTRSYSDGDSRQGGYPGDRIRGGQSVQRSGSKSWNRDGYRSSDERGGGRPRKTSTQRHDFKSDNYKPVRKFNRRENGGNND